MRIVLISAALLSSVAIATPAAAQWGQQQRYSQNRNYDGQGSAELRQDIEQLANRIQRSEERGAITRREGANLRESLNVLQERYRQYSRGGLSRSEYMRLRQRMDDLVRNLREERQDGRFEDRRDGRQSGGWENRRDDRRDDRRAGQRARRW